MIWIQELFTLKMLESLIIGWLIGHVARLITIGWRNHVTSTHCDTSVQLTVRQQESSNCVVHAVANAIAFNKSAYLIQPIELIDHTDEFERCASVLGRCHAYRFVTSYYRLIPDYCAVSMWNGIMYKQDIGMSLAQQFANLKRNLTGSITFLCQYDFMGEFANTHRHMIAIMLVKPAWGAIHLVVLDSNNIDINSSDLCIPVPTTFTDQVSQFQDEIMLKSYRRGIFALLEYIDKLRISAGLV